LQTNVGFKPSKNANEMLYDFQIESHVSPCFTMYLYGQVNTKEGDAVVVVVVITFAGLNGTQTV
jgi:hypothetical protein